MSSDVKNNHQSASKHLPKISFQNRESGKKLVGGKIPHKQVSSSMVNTIHQQPSELSNLDLAIANESQTLLRDGSKEMIS